MVVSDRDGFGNAGDGWKVTSRLKTGEIPVVVTVLTAVTGTGNGQRATIFGSAGDGIKVTFGRKTRQIPVRGLAG